MATEETLCPHCGKTTRTILGGCPECGGPKENPVYFEPRVAPGGRWRDDFPFGRYVLWGSTSLCVIALIVLAIVLEAELAFGVIAVLALAAYAWDRLS